MFFCRKHRLSKIAVFTGLALSVFSAAALAASTATLVKTHKAWSVYSFEGASKKVCFAASSPKTTKPKGASRSSIYFYISNWPNEGVKTEISVRLGYPIKPGSSVGVRIGGKTFNLFAKDNNAFVADAIEELKLIDAMKAGSTMTISAVSSRGTKTTDGYSLSGITASLSTLVSACK